MWRPLLVTRAGSGGHCCVWGPALPVAGCVPGHVVSCLGASLPPSGGPLHMASQRGSLSGRSGMPSTQAGQTHNERSPPCWRCARLRTGLRAFRGSPQSCRQVQTLPVCAYPHSSSCCSPAPASPPSLPQRQPWGPVQLGRCKHSPVAVGRLALLMVSYTSGHRRPDIHSQS